MSGGHGAVDYCVLGTLTRDLLPDGSVRLGGTAAFSGAMAAALGLRTGICARVAADLDCSELETGSANLELVRQPSTITTTFENRYEAEGRVQYLHARAPAVTLDGVPDPWLTADIVHLGPLCQDLDPAIGERCSGKLLGVTPQGWLRGWDEHGRVRPCAFADPEPILARADAIVLSMEDVGHDFAQIGRWAERAKLLVVTDAERGATVLCGGLRRNFAAPRVAVVDPTGAGDLFAAAFFVELRAGADPWAAAERAVWLTSMLLARRRSRFPDAALVRQLWSTRRAVFG